MLTASEFRQHFETDMADLAIDRIIAGEDAEIVRRYGDPESRTVTLTGGGVFLGLPARASSVTTVTETVAETDTVLDVDDDYRVLDSGYSLERIGAFWAHVVTVAFVPYDMAYQRTHALIQLTKLSIQYSGMERERVGDYEGYSKRDYSAERESILRSLAPKGMVIA